MSKDNTLKSKKDFKRIYDKGKSFANKYLVLFFLKNDLTYNRVGFVTTKKLGNSVIRNRFKRRLRESYRLSEEDFLQGYDIILLSRAGAKDVGYKEIDSALRHIFSIARLVKKG